MAVFRRVDGEQAGPTALGILVPPGLRTLVILRPRALEWDLVLERTGEDGVAGPWQVWRHEATGLVGRLHRGLEAWAGGGAGGTRTGPAPGAAGWHLRLEVGGLMLGVCRRVPGEPYRPAVFDTADAARAAAARLEDVLRPADGEERAIYFNTSRFAR